MRAYESDLDEIVAMVADMFECGAVDGTPAVTILRESTGLCEVRCAGLLVRETLRRDQEVKARDAAAEQQLRDMGLGDDGRWTP